MNVFEKHNVMYLSASTVNLFISQPAMCLLKIAGLTDSEAGPAAWRGTGVDKALTKLAFDPLLNNDTITKKAIESFDAEHEKALNDHGDKVEKERRAIPNYIETAADFYRDLGVPEKEQGKVTLMIDEIPVPFIGYYDLLYTDKVRDIKTVGRAVNSVTASASRQVSIYATATKREPWIDYVTPKQITSHKVENADMWLRQVQLAAKSLERILSYSDDTLECCQLVYPDLDHWMWNNAMKAIAKDVWKMEKSYEMPNNDIKFAF